MRRLASQSAAACVSTAACAPFVPAYFATSLTTMSCSRIAICLSWAAFCKGEEDDEEEEEDEDAHDSRGTSSSIDAALGLDAGRGAGVPPGEMPVSVVQETVRSAVGDRFAL